MGPSEGDHARAADGLDDVLDQATTLLKDDAELRLDVRAELASHLEDKRDDFRAKGHSEEASAELAAQALGPPDALARDLLTANRRRMKLRALARLALRAVVVPAGLAAVLIFGSWQHLRPLSASPAEAFGESDSSNMGDDLSFLVQEAEYRRWEELSPEALLIVNGDWRHGNSHHERIRATWEAHPARIEFCADYIASFANTLARLHEHFARRLLGRSGRKWNPDHIERVRRKLGNDMAKFEPDLARARALDPDNAFFDYLHAAVLAAGGCREEAVPPTAEDRARPPLVHRTKFVVVDPELLDQATKALISGNTKSRYESYAVELRRAKLAVLPRKAGVSDILHRLAWCGLGRRPNMALARLASSSAAWAEELASEGRSEEAFRILDATVRMFTRSVPDVDEHWSNRNAFILVQSVEERLPPVYERLGRTTEATRIRALAEQIKAVTKAGLCGLDGDVWKHTSTHGGTTLDFLHRSGSGDPDVLAAAREIDQLLLDRSGMSLLLMTLFALAAGCAFVSVRWRLPRSTVVAIPPLLPRPAFLARVLGLGVFLPLAAYFVYTQWTGIAGREYSIRYLGHRFLLEIVLLVVTISAVIVSLARGYVRDRCADLGTPTPRRTSPQLRVGLWSALAVAWVSCLAMRGEGSERAAHIIITAILSLAVIGLTAELVFLAGRRRLFTAYYAAFARTLVLTFAAAALVAGCVVNLHLHARGRRIAMSAEAFKLDEELQVPKFDADVFRPIRTNLARIAHDFEVETAREQ